MVSSRPICVCVFNVYRYCIYDLVVTYRDKPSTRFLKHRLLSVIYMALFIEYVNTLTLISETSLTNIANVRSLLARK